MKQAHVRQDPATGDPLTLGEWISWKVQGIIRRWTFLMIVTLVTIVVWSTNNPLALTWWNLGASYLALVIESVVGLAMYNQTRRDAVILRRIDRLEEQNLAQLQRIDALLESAREGA